MKDQSNIWPLLQMLIFTFVSLGGVLLAIYGIYQITIAILPPTVEISTVLVQ